MHLFFYSVECVNEQCQVYSQTCCQILLMHHSYYSFKAKRGVSCGRSRALDAESSLVSSSSSDVRHVVCTCSSTPFVLFNKLLIILSALAEDDVIFLLSCISSGICCCFVFLVVVTVVCPFELLINM